MAGTARIRFLFQPARSLRAAGLAQLSRELGALAERRQPPALANRILALAREPSGELRGFASARLLPVPGLGEALHLEDVRVVAAEREALAERLALALVRGYGLRFRFPARLWCAFDSTGPCRIAESLDCEQMLAISCAVDSAVRRLTRPPGPAPERWAAWLGAALTPVVRFELAGRVLETGFVGLGGLLSQRLRRRASQRPWGTAALPASSSRTPA